MANLGCIFDWDGTIVDSGRTHEKTWIRLAEAHGLELIPDFFSITFGKRNIEIISRILKWTDDPAEIAKLSDEKERMYRAIIAERSVPPVAGVEDFLRLLNARGALCAVGSSTPRANLDATVAKLGYGGFFRAYVASEDVSRGKPAPDVFLEAAKRLGLPPHKCAVFEDSLAGIQAGVAAGMKTVAVATTNTAEFWREASADPASRCDLVIGDFAKVSPADIEALFAQ